MDRVLLEVGLMSCSAVLVVVVGVGFVFVMALDCRRSMVWWFFVPWSDGRSGSGGFVMALDFGRSMVWWVFLPRSGGLRCFLALRSGEAFTLVRLPLEGS